MATDQVGQGSPWVSVWLKPRLTIERVLTNYRTRWILLLAALNAIFSVFNLMITEGHVGAGLFDWRVLVSVTLGAGALGVGFLYLAGHFFKWSGRLFSGHATAAELRAVIAWGLAPSVMGLAVVFAIAIGLRLAGVLSPTSRGTELALQVIAGVLGLWSLAVSLLMLSRVQKFGFWRTILSYALGYTWFSLLILLPLLFRTFAFEPFNIPSSSMSPSLVVGDYLFVSKYRYGYSRYSLPFSPPLFVGRIFGKEPERGDVVVYRQPRNPSFDFIKRLVGLPGERIQMKDGVLLIDGQPVARESAGDYIVAIDKWTPLQRGKKWRETLPNGASYETLDLGSRFLDNTEILVVPRGHYFVIGDNRANSMDSRSPAAQGGGFVPFENLVGRAEFIFYSHGASAETREDAMRFDRIGTAVQ